MNERAEKGIEDYINSLQKTTQKADPLAEERKQSPEKFRRLNEDLDITRENNPDLLNSGYDEIPTRDNAFVKSNHTSHRDGKNVNFGANTNKDTYGARKRKQGVEEDYMVVDKCHDLEKENLVLKEKENLLEREILKMQTKLRRIEELMKTKKTFSDNDFARLQKDLEDQFGEIMDENTVINDRIKKLKIIHKHLTTKGTTTNDLTTKQKQKTYHVIGGGTSIGGQAGGRYGSKSRPVTSASSNKVYPYIPGQKQVVPKHMELLEELKIQLVKNEKEIIKLTAEKQRFSSLTTGQVTVDDLMRKIRERESEIRDITKQFDEIEQSFIKKESIFKDSKAYIEHISKEITEVRSQNQLLSMKNNKLSIVASQTKTLQDQYNDTVRERDMIEAQIRTITSEPFFNREKGQSTLKRIAELEEKLVEKEKQSRVVRDEEAKKTKEMSDYRPLVEKLRGEKEYLEKENKKLKERFKENNNVDEFNVYKTLFQLDSKKYAETIKDFQGKPDKYPIWSEMDFLERGTEPLTNEDLKGLKVEINKIRHENKDLAAELEKAQNLFKLQEDIERDNTRYFEGEQQRLVLMEKSTAMKAEELARRADEKQRQINDFTRKLGMSGQGLSKSPSPLKGDPRRSMNDIYETQSEFSVMTNESEIKTDENVMDFVVQDAEYYYEAFKSVLDEREMMLHQKTLITFVTVDFYNHDTETSQIAEGYRPIYNTQFSFKNRVDDFFVQFLQKNVMKLDIYISKNNAAIHLGHAEVFLREIVERENIMQEMSIKPPVIQKTVRIFGARGNSDQPIGSLRFKMRMRKPISEAIRFYRERNEIQNLQVAHDTFIEGGINNSNRKKLITIQIVGCKDIKSKYSEISKMQPFFYYQFYNFDERYSITGSGNNPVFEDTMNYDVEFDAKLITYLQKEPLEIILFDDYAPITGVERGGRADKEAEQNDDMIGTVKIPLTNLIKGSGIVNKFDIRNNRNEPMGYLEAKISIIDVDGGFSSIANRDLQQQAATMHYNKKWEDEFVYRIARKLAKFPGDVELLFGIFARGQKTVAKEDFRYTCLKRLQLKNEISEREIDMFLKGSPVLIDKNVMDLEDFLQIFSAKITQARNDFQNEEAMQFDTIRKYEHQVQNQRSVRSIHQADQDPFSQSTTSRHDFRETLNASRMSIGFQEQEILDILAKTRFGNFTLMRDRIKAHTINGQITSSDLIGILSHDGGIGDFEARRVSQYFENKGHVNIAKFEEYLNRAVQFANINSEAYKKFINLICSDKVDLLVKKFQSLDYNKDGSLNKDGFASALLSYEFNHFSPEQALEVFTIVCRDNQFYYKEFIIQHNPNAKISLLSRSTTPGLIRTETPATLLSNMPQVPMNESISESQTIGMVGAAMYEDPRLREIKNKLKNYITQQDITLSSLFQLIDTDSNLALSLNEFLSKMKALQTSLDDAELRHLFSVLDKTGRGNITYKQFVMEFPEINVSYMIKKIKKIVIGAGTSYEKVFHQYCGNKTQLRMTMSEFKKFAKTYVTKAEDFEIESLFRHFTQDLRDFVTLENFKDAFGSDVRDQVFKIGIEDIIKPLQSKINAFGTNKALLFDKYDQNGNGKMSAEELAEALKKDQKLILMDDEVQIFKDYFKQHYKTSEIYKSDFIKLLETKFERKADTDHAKKALALLKEKLEIMKRSPAHVLAPFDAEQTGNLSLRNFKVGLNSLRVLSEFQIHNLAKWLDKQDDGYISISDLDVALRQAHLPMSSTGSFALTDKKEKYIEKWKTQK